MSFGVFWFCLFLQPLFMITSSVALITLYYAHFPRAWLAFHVLWIINAATYIFITGFALMIDPKTGRHTWRQGVMFPGAVNLAIIAYTCFPRLFRDAAQAALGGPVHVAGGIVFAYAWLTFSMAAGYLAKAARAAPVRPVPQPAARLPGGLRVGAVRLHVRVLREGTAPRRDDLGQDREDGEGGDTGVNGSDRAFRREIREAVRYERGLVVKALLALAVVAVMVILRILYFT